MLKTLTITWGGILIDKLLTNVQSQTGKNYKNRPTLDNITVLARHPDCVFKLAVPKRPHTSVSVGALYPGLQCWHAAASASKKVKVAHTRLPSIGLELILVLGSQPAGDVSHKPSGRLPLLSARPAVTPATLKRAAINFCCLVNRGTMGVNILPKTVTRQRRSCGLNPGPSASESSTLTTPLPSHPYQCTIVDV